MNNKPFKTKIGGQAVMEGIMMKGPEKSCLAVRLPDGSVHTETEPTRKNPAVKIPFVRGAVAMVLNLMDGYRYLMRSSDLAFPEDAEESKTAFDRWLEHKFGDKAASAIGVVCGALAAFLAIAMFVVLPTFLTGLLAKIAPIDNFRSIIEGVLKMLIFVLYLFLITRIKDIHRVYEYHGAEHKTIACYEHGEQLTVENVKKHSRFHPRCGTSFIFIVLILSILVSSVITWESTLVRAALKLASLPVVMGVAYELIQFAARHENLLCRALSAPGLWVQRLTAFEPDDSQIEVAIAAMTAVIPQDREQAQW